MARPADLTLRPQQTVPLAMGVMTRGTVHPRLGTIRIHEQFGPRGLHSERRSDVARLVGGRRRVVPVLDSAEKASRCAVVSRDVGVANAADRGVSHAVDIDWACGGHMTKLANVGAFRGVRAGISEAPPCHRVGAAFRRVLLESNAHRNRRDEEEASYACHQGALSEAGGDR